MKIGIVSLYYKSLNYGANLQAYALCQYFRKKGICAEQIKIDNSVPIRVIPILKEVGIKVFIERVILKIINFPTDIHYKYARKIHKKEVEEVIATRKEAFYEFHHQIIPNSKDVYKVENAEKLLDEYDIFIAGSDQLWNLGWYIKKINLYYLDFVPQSKVKLSYAASNTMKSINKEQEMAIKRSLSDYKAVSVREQSTVNMFGKFLDKKPVLVVDPTLLLDENDWNVVCDERIVEGNYIFCYFLGTNRKIRNLIKRFAEKKNLKTVEISYASGKFEILNGIQADIILNDVSPQKFLSLIKYSDYICTDSFHAIVFSFIYKKQFFVFSRNKKQSMSTRIKNITKLFDMEERFCEKNDMQTIDYMEGLKEINYSRNFPELDRLRKVSYQYLEKNVLSLFNKTN